ncbi:MAG: dTMP kinase [Kofleriaceae bacterium]|nr:dTMP kinase [Kofleriaceae bacterium]
MSQRPLLFVFEGIDGSGKTTISNKVAEAVRAHGIAVRHVRADGRLASDVAENIRQFTRDQINAALDPFSELLLYTARESQQLQEVIRPALERGEVVIADRFLHTAEVLAHDGRGLPLSRIAPILKAARDGIEPALTILIDVDPVIAQARRRADKIARPTVRTSSRKGLSGGGLMERLRLGYLRRAAAQGWLVVDNTAADLDALVAQLTRAILDTRAGTPITRVARSPVPALPRVLDEARGALLAWVEHAAAREPEVAAYLLGGLHGSDVDALRRSLIARAPAVVAAGLRGLDDEASWALRHDLSPRVPAAVARTLGGFVEPPERAWPLRAQLAADAPAEVAESLTGLACDRAWELRELLWRVAPSAVVRSLAGDTTLRARTMRERWLARIGGVEQLADRGHAWTAAASVRGNGDAESWHLRELARPAAPIAALLSLEGVHSERAWAWRRAWILRAPRPVLRTLAGLDHEQAWELRARAGETAKEVLGTIIGMDHPAAWALRTSLADRWPASIVKSLGPLAATDRGRALVERQLARYPDNLALLRHVALLDVGAGLRKAVA